MPALKSTILLIGTFMCTFTAYASDKTSTEMYCETMTIAFFESALEGKLPSSAEHGKRIEAAEREMLETCKAMPLVGGSAKKLQDMTAKQIAQLSCLAIATGTATAQYSKSNDQLLYSKLAQNRAFFDRACASNREQFLSDIRKYGAYHVLNKSY